MQHRRLVAIIASVVLATVIAPSPAQAACPSASRSEKGFVKKTNASRANAGRGNLSLDLELSAAARAHTREMVKKNELYHTPNDTLKKRVTNWIELGENVGVGSSVASLHEAFMNSTAHRENILYSKWKYIGVGVVKADGRMWVTVLFERDSNPDTPLC